MKLIQIFIPLYDVEGNQFPGSIYESIKQLLTSKFDGLTIYQRSPAIGLWKENNHKTIKDDIIIYEIITEDVDKDFWLEFKKDKQEQLKQEELLIRSFEIQII